MTEPRIAPGTLRQLGPINWAFCRVASRTLGLPDMHIFSTLGRTGGLFRGWLYYSARLMPFGTLSRRDTEMVILRTAHLRESAYEMDHHIRLGRRAGIDAAMVERIVAGPDAGWSARDTAILTAVDELVTDRDITDRTWQTITEHLTERQQIGLVMLVGQYDSLATTLGTLRVQRDR